MRTCLLFAALVVAGCASPDVAPVPTPPSVGVAPPEAASFALEPFADGFSRPLLLTHDAEGALYGTA